MNIVCFSYNGPPKNDAEGFCTARFLSALAQQGATVHFITMDHADEIDTPMLTLLDSDIKVTRIPLNGNRSGVRVLRRALLGAQGVYLPECVAAVKRALHSSALLITRANPVLSNLVGYACREYAAGWSAHFGDPFPGLHSYSRRNAWRKLVDRERAKKIFREADLVTVTCRNAIRWFVEHLGDQFKQKMHMTYHIGFPHLRTGNPSNQKRCDGIVKFTHVGLLNAQRFVGRVIEEFSEATKVFTNLQLEHYGPVDEVGKKLFTQSARSISISIRNTNEVSPLMSSELIASSDVNVVIDQGEDIGYCPYFPSKFAYCVASGRPILAISEPDSEMARLHNEYGSFYFADATRRGALSDVVQQIARTPLSELSVPSEALSDLFRPETVAKAFLNRAEDVLRKRRGECIRFHKAIEAHS